LNVIESSGKFDDSFYYYRVGERRAGISQIVLHFEPACLGTAGIVKTFIFPGRRLASRRKNPDKS
jgi:hypothetical protein